MYWTHTINSAAAINNALTRRNPSALGAKDSSILRSVTVHISSAPTTSQNFVITLTPAEGPTFATVIYKQDLAAGSITDISLTDVNVILLPGDVLTTTYTNTDTRTFGIRYVLED